MVRFLVGICGIGYGHSLRESLLIRGLAERGAHIVVFCFGKSLEFMQTNNPCQVPWLEVGVPWVYTRDGQVDWKRTEAANITDFPRRQRLSLTAFQAVSDLLGGKPDVCVSDYEPETASYAYQQDIPLITLDQQSKFLGYCTDPLPGFSRDEERARLSYFFPYAERRIAVSFYRLNAPADGQFQVEIYPSPVRAEVVASARQRRVNTHQHRALVYLSPYGPLKQSMAEIIRVLESFTEWQFVIYNHQADHRSLSPATNIQFRSFDRLGFAHDLSQSAALISTAGHTLLSEAVFLRVPTFTLPLETYDQHYCGRMIAEKHVGITAQEVTVENLADFLEHLSEFSDGLSDGRFTVSDGFSEALIDVIWQTVVSRAGKRVGSRTMKTAHQGNTSTQVDAGYIPAGRVADHLYLPDPHAWLQPAQPGPVSYRTAVIKPTMACMCRCDACQPRSKRWWQADAQTLTLPEWLSILDQLSECDFQVVQISGGEPMVYTRLPELIRAIRQRNMTALLNTNGYLLSPVRLTSLVKAGLDGINFSLDSPKPSVHDSLRQCQKLWQHAVTGIRAAQAYRGQLWTAIRMLMTSQTLLDLPEMLRLAIELGAGSLKLSYLEWGYPDSPLLPSLETLQRFKEIVLPVCLEVVESSQLNGEQKDRTCAILENLLYPEHANSLENYTRGIYWGSREYCLHCNLPNSLVILYGDGSVLPCNAAEYSRRALNGNLHADRLADILFGVEMETYRRQRSEVCLYCPMPLHLTLPLWAEYT